MPISRLDGLRGWGRSIFLTMAGVVLSALGNGVAAQDVPLGAPAGFESPSGLTIGDFKWVNRVQIGVNATSNIRADPSEQSDGQSVFFGASALQSSWDRHALAATVSYLDKRAFEVTEQKSNALSYSLSGRVDLDEAFSVSGGLLHTESIVSQNSPQQFSGNLNGTTAQDIRELEFAWNGSSYFASLQGRDMDVSSDTDINTTVLSRLQQQERTEQDATLQVGVKRDWGKFYGLAGVQNAQYTGSAVILPEDRDSRGVRLGFGIETSKPAGTNVIFRLIGIAQDFEAPTIDDVNTLIGTFQVRHSLNQTMALAGKLERTFDEVNIQGSGGVLTNSASVGFQQQLSQKLYYQFGPTYRYYTIAGTSYQATSEAFDITVGYQIHPRVELLFNAGVLNQDVNSPDLANLEYTEQHFTVSTVITF